MVFIGIDHSLSATAIAAIDGETGKFLKGIVCKAAMDGPARLVKIRAQAELFINQFKAVALVGIENYAFGSKWGREALGELGGVLRVKLYEMGLEYVEIAPTQLKQFATGKGTAQKDHVLMAVYKKWGLEFETNDEADAFVAAQMARAVCFTQRGWTDGLPALNACETGVINKIINPEKKPKKGKKKKEEAS